MKSAEFPEEKVTLQIELMDNAQHGTEVKDGEEWHVNKVQGETKLTVESGGKLVIKDFESGEVVVKKGGELLVLQKSERAQIINE